MPRMVTVSGATPVPDAPPALLLDAVGFQVTLRSFKLMRAVRLPLAGPRNISSEPRKLAPPMG